MLTERERELLNSNSVAEHRPVSLSPEVTRDADMITINRIIGGIGFAKPLSVVGEEKTRAERVVVETIKNLLKENTEVEPIVAEQGGTIVAAIHESGLRDYVIQVNDTGIIFDLLQPKLDDANRTVSELIPRIYEKLASDLDRPNDIYFEGCRAEFLLPFKTERLAQQYLITRFLKTDSGIEKLGSSDPLALDFEIVIAQGENAFLSISAEVSTTSNKGEAVGTGDTPVEGYYVEFGIDRRLVAPVPLSAVGSWTRESIQVFYSPQIQAFLLHGVEE